MKKTKVSGPGVRVSLAALAVAFAFGLASCDSNQAAITPSPAPTVGETIVATPSASSPAPSAQARTVVYRVGTNRDGEAQLEPVEIDADPADPATAVFAINKMAEMKNSPFPEGIRALSVRFQDGLATVDFNREFFDNYPQGDRKEALMLNALMATLGQFENSRQVLVMVEGKKAELGEMQDLTEPLQITPELMGHVRAASRK